MESVYLFPKFRGVGYGAAMASAVSNVGHTVLNNYLPSVFKTGASISVVVEAEYTSFGGESVTKMIYHQLHYYLDDFSDEYDVDRSNLSISLDAGF